MQKDYAKAQLRNEQQVQIVTPSFTMLLMAELIIFIKSLMYSCNMLISEKVAGDKYLGNLKKEKPLSIKVRHSTKEKICQQLHQTYKSTIHPVTYDAGLCSSTATATSSRRSVF